MSAPIVVLPSPSEPSVVYRSELEELSQIRLYLSEILMRLNKISTRQRKLRAAYKNGTAEANAKSLSIARRLARGDPVIDDRPTGT
jgi:hypothetical protein